MDFHDRRVGKILELSDTSRLSKSEARQQYMDKLNAKRQSRGGEPEQETPASTDSGPYRNSSRVTEAWARASKG